MTCGKCKHYRLDKISKKTGHCKKHLIWMCPGEICHTYEKRPFINLGILRMGAAGAMAMFWSIIIIGAWWWIW